MTLQNEIERAVHKHAALAAELSDALYAQPELSDEEYEASRKMAHILREKGFAVTCPYLGLGTAFSAVLENGEGPRVAILAEYDALPEIGHGCGHNLHGALSILAALALMELKEYFQGTLHIIGTPAEETTGRKIDLAEQGAFDGLDLAMMIHSACGATEANMDAVSLRCYDFEFFGRTAHAVGSPSQGRSALAAARKFLDLVDARRECFTPDLFANAVILDGGKSPNVIPDYARVRMEFRAASIGRLSGLDDAITKCARGAALALDCEAKWKRVYSDFADVVRNTPLEARMKEIFEALGETVNPVLPPQGSTDMGNVSYRCPAIQPRLSISKEPYAAHTREFAAATVTPYAHKAMQRGACSLVRLALDVFNDSEFRTLVHRDFLAQLEEKEKV